MSRCAWLLVVGVTLGLATATACSSENGTGACMPNLQLPCACGNTLGQKVCREDGSGYTECLCGQAGTDGGVILDDAAAGGDSTVGADLSGVDVRGGRVDVGHPADQSSPGDQGVISLDAGTPGDASMPRQDMCPAQGCGGPEVLASGQTPSDLAISGDEIFWLNRGDNGASSGSVNALTTLPLEATPRILADNQNSPTALVVDDTHVYWANTGIGPLSGSINRVERSGNNFTQLAGTELNPSSMAIDANSVYWMNTASTGDVRKIDKISGDVNIVANNLPDPIALQLKNGVLYWIHIGGSADIVSVPASVTGPTMPTVVVPGQSGAEFLDVEDTDIYWATTSNDVFTQSLAPASQPRRLGSVMGAAGGIAFDGQDVFVSDLLENEIVRIPQGGGANIPFASSFSPSTMRLDALYVYWISESFGPPANGAVLRLAR